MGQFIERRTETEMIASMAQYLPGGMLFELATVPGTNFNALLAGLSGMLLDADNFMFLYNSEFIPTNTTVFIEEWESALGIPDDCFLSDPDATSEERRNNILVKLASLGVQTVDDFQGLATILGLENVQVVPGVGGEIDSIVNGNFNAVITPWTLGTGWSYSVGNSNVSKVAGVSSDLQQGIAVVDENPYLVTYTLTNVTAGSIRANIGGTYGEVRTENGTFTELITAGTSQSFFLEAASDFVGTVDTVSAHGSAGTPFEKFTLVVRIPLNNFPAFPLDFPIPFGDPFYGVLTCLITKLKPANVQLLTRTYILPEVCIFPLDFEVQLGCD